MNKDKFFLLNLKKRSSHNGRTFYTGKYAYAIDIIAFEKKDGSGDLTLWLEPKDMDQINPQNKGYAQDKTQQQQRAAPSPRIPVARPVARPPQPPMPPPAPIGDPPSWDDEPELPF